MHVAEALSLLDLAATDENKSRARDLVRAHGVVEVEVTSELAEAVGRVALGCPSLATELAGALVGAARSSALAAPVAKQEVEAEKPRKRSSSQRSAGG